MAWVDLHASERLDWKLSLIPISIKYMVHAICYMCNTSSWARIDICRLVSFLLYYEYHNIEFCCGKTTYNTKYICLLFAQINRITIFNCSLTDLDVWSTGISINRQEIVFGFSQLHLFIIIVQLVPFQILIHRSSVV